MTDEHIFMLLLPIPVFIGGIYAGRLYELLKRDHLMEQMRILRQQRKQALKLIKERKRLNGKHAA